MASPSSNRTKPPIVLTIAGFDPSNGAGITADLQVFAAHGLFGTSAITALTVQNTLGVSSIHPIDPIVLRDTLFALLSDLPPVGVKIGMLANAEIVHVVSDFLRVLHEKHDRNHHIPIVLDPVITSSSGAKLLDDEGVEAIRRELFALVDCITPNRQELIRLDGPKAGSENSTTAIFSAMNECKISSGVPAILTTGGEESTATDLLLLPDGTEHILTSPRIETTSTHGTGCAYSSALLSNLVLGKPLLESATYAKAFVENALRSAPNLGHGHGPMNLSHSETMAYYLR